MEPRIHQRTVSGFLGSVDVAVVFTPAHGAQVMIGFFWRLTELQFEVYLASIESTICCVICFPDPIHSGVCGVSGCYIGVWGVKVCPGPGHPSSHTGHSPETISNLSIQILVYTIHRLDHCTHKWHHPCSHTGHSSKTSRHIQGTLDHSTHK